MSKFTPFIWFENQAEEAMEFYTFVFPGSRIVHIERYTGDQGIPGEEQLKGKVLTGIFELGGQQFQCLDGGKQPGFELNSGAISFLMEFDEQSELDGVWDKLMDGGKPQQCGWIVDKFGVTWQIVPKVLGDLMGDPTATPGQKKALAGAMMPMVKLDGPKLKEAFDSAG
jgi:predicted 3-demethylubiquinone-9 3-methyltransferase (glyoxalase superfamily)